MKRKATEADRNSLENTFDISGSLRRTTEFLSDLFSAITTIVSVVSCYIWRSFCVKVLKRRFNIETPTYRKWWRKRANAIQRALDAQHSAKHDAQHDNTHSNHNNYEPNYYNSIRYSL